MRLLFVSQSFPPKHRPQDNLGGMQRVAVELYDALCAHPDLDLDALVLRSSWRWHHVVGVPWWFRTLRRIRQKAEAGEIDAVLFSSMAVGAMAPWLKKTLAPLGIPMAAIAHGRDVTLPGPYQRYVRHVFDALDTVFPVSRATAAACRERGMPPEKIQVLPNGVKRRRFEPLADLSTMRRELREAVGDPAYVLPDDHLLLCSVGRQVERKGFAWFIDEVMPLLPEDVHYWLAGEGPEMENIIAAAEGHGLGRRVRLLGRISDSALHTLLRGADLFVMPNVPVPGDMEGFGVVLLEAGLCGTPAIAARLEGIRDVITEGANGHLVESGDAWGFSEAIMRYYHDRAAMNAAAERTATHTAESFCWAAIASRFVESMEALLPAPLAFEEEEAP